MDTAIYDQLFDSNDEFGCLDMNCSVEIGLVVSGVGVHRVMNQVIPCQAGDIFVINEHVPHRYYSSERGASMTVRRISFAPKEWLCAPYDSSSDSDFVYGCFRENKIIAYTMLTRAIYETVASLFNEIALEFFERKDAWRDVVRARMVLLLTSIARYTNRSIKHVPQTMPDTWNPVSRVIAMIHEKYSNSELTLESIASSVHVSRAYLGKIFKQSTGVAFSDFLKHVRLENARTMLIETDSTVEEIMTSCGMRDSLSFYKAFGEHFGMTPNHYRKQYAKEKQGVNILNEISENLQKGKGKIVADLVEKALEEGVKANEILNEGLLAGMSIVGEKFKNNEVFVPEVMASARAMNKGTAILKPHLSVTEKKTIGKVCIGTVQGDLHDIGKNLVKIMLEAKGLEVIDLGVDVAPETFVQTAINEDCRIICCSALLTTTMRVMADVVNKSIEMGVRDKIKIMIGGAPVSEAFCKEIGADIYTADAAAAAEIAVKICEN